MSFQQGLSGLNVAAKNLDAIGNNVANASTVGYKSARAEFADVFANSLAGGGTQIGIGASVTAVKQQFSQGNIVSSANPLDVAINGSGFFRLSNDGSISYSRNGQFSLDRDGFVVANDGARLTGYPADINGQVDRPRHRSTCACRWPIFRRRRPATSRIAMNLDSREAPPVAAFDINDPTSYNSSTAMTIYDSQGNAHTLTMYFRKTAANDWDVHAAADGAVLMPARPIGTLDLRCRRRPGGERQHERVDPADQRCGHAAGFPGASFRPARRSQFGVNFAVSQLSQDGFTTGRIAGFSIGTDGVILGRYTNGQTRAQGQIVLADFTNAQGLVPMGNNQWAESSDSGQPLVASPGAGSLGTAAGRLARGSRTST